MNFASDNAAGAAPGILEAIVRANEGTAGSYGADAITAHVTEKLSALFERKVAYLPVATGTAANSLALATLVPPHGAVFCHEGAHLNVDECGAPEFFSGGAKLVALKGKSAKLTPEAIAPALARLPRGVVHHPQPAAISITQATELGTSYTEAEVAALGTFAKREKLALHMDGARFANALAHLKCKPADITWKAGVDALSFGVTKNGALAAEAVIFFDPAQAQDFQYRRKRAGHLFSKMRFVSAQFEAMLENDLWLKLARHANAMATHLAQGLRAIEGFTIAEPVEGNEVFAKFPSPAKAKALQDAGAKFYEWEPTIDNRPLIRLVCSWATKEADVDRFLGLARTKM